MIYYEVVCFYCRQLFTVYEGTPEYKYAKENRDGKHVCESCSHTIQLEARLNFFK